MIGNALEQEIIGLYNVDINSMYSINQIASLLNKKYPYINKKVTFLIEQNIFKMTIVGRSHLCSLNLKNEETIFTLILNEIKRKKAALEKNSSLNKIMGYIERLSKTADLRIVLKNEDSIIFISENKEKCDNVSKGVLKQAFYNYKSEFLTKDEFLKKLLNDNSLHQKKVILYGFEKYYEYIREIEDELKIRYSKLMP